MIHKTPHPLAGKTVTLNLAGEPPADPIEFVVEDYWDRITGGSWMFANGNPAAITFAVRSAGAGLPTDDEVVYGKKGPFGHIVHVSELGAEVTREG